MLSGRFALTVALFLAACSTPVQRRLDTLKLPEGVFDEFRYVGNALVCVSSGESASGRDCLHIGNLRLQQDLAEIERILGQPYTVLPREPTGELRVYLLQGPDPAPYMAVTVEDGRASAIQLTGTFTSEPYNFSSISLGDPVAKVEEILGKPSSISPVSDIGATMWGYLPFPISIEIKEGKVFSIRIG